MESNNAKGNALGFKTIFGTTTMNGVYAISQSLMQTMFMLFLTDYAGLGAYGAVMGATVLLAARIFDAVNDPFQGWIMDRAKVGKHGKYKMFIFLSITLQTVGTIGLFFLPSGVIKSHLILGIWLLFFYLFWDMGATFFAPNLLFRTITIESDQRAKLQIAPRIFTLFVGMFLSSFIAIVNSVNQAIGNFQTAFGVTVLMIIAISAVISYIGIIMVKEKYHAPADASEKVKITDIFLTIRDNKPLRVKLLSTIFGGFIWALVFSCSSYYIKWAYCANLLTGEVDTALFGTYSIFLGMLTILPLLLGTVIAVPIMKALGSPLRCCRVLLLFQATPLGILFFFQVIGILQASPVLFFTCLGITTLAMGAAYVPGEVINIESMDYDIYKNKKDRAGLCNASIRFLDKAQAAVATAVTGILLVAIGYSVDSVTDTYTGDLASIPSLLTGFAAIIGIIPFILGIIAWYIWKAYPINDQIREEMKQVLVKE